MYYRVATARCVFAMSPSLRRNSCHAAKVNGGGGGGKDSFVGSHQLLWSCQSPGRDVIIGPTLVETCSQPHRAPPSPLPPLCPLLSALSYLESRTDSEEHTPDTHTHTHMNAERLMRTHTKMQTDTQTETHIAETHARTRRHAHNAVVNVKSLPRV